MAKFCYKVTDFWHPNDEIGISWDDPNIGIEWTLEEGQKPIMSERDMHYPRFITLAK